MKKKVLMSWSTGKDSAWSLFQLQQQAEYEVIGLFCSINKKFSRTAMHAVRLELLQKQADVLGLPLDIIELPFPCSNDDYERIMQEFMDDVKKRDVEYFCFGDLFLQDIRDYRLKQLENTGISAIFPLWGQATKPLAEEMLEGGLKAVITCVDPKQLSGDFVGREYNQTFLDDLPEGVDPCGENGEFHSFVFSAPNFSAPIDVAVTQVVVRDGFVFADVELATE